MISHQFTDFLFLLGDDSIDLFNYFNANKLHGLSRKDCENKTDTKYSAFIAGMCNVIPNSENKMYIFINSKRLGNGHKDITLIFHEAMHLAFWKYNYDVSKEEEMITYAELTTSLIHRLLKLNLCSIEL
jgi:hypothetical protein